MRVAVFSDSYSPHKNGVAVLLEMLHEAERPWDEEIFAPLAHEHVRKIFSIPSVPYPEYRFALDKGAINKALKDFDIIHAHTPYNSFYYAYKAAGKLGKPFVGSFHTDPAAVFGSIVSSEGKIGPLASQLTWRYLLRLYKQCDVIIAVSPWVKEELQKRGIKNRIEIISNCVDTMTFKKIDPTNFKEKYRIPDKPTILFMGRLEKKKDPANFIRAAKSLKFDANFIISGRGRLEKSIKKVVASDNRFIFLDSIPKEEVPQAFSTADLFVCSSEMETHGLVIAESLACGTPCISTDVGIARELLPEEQIVPIHDSNALASMILDALGEPRALRKSTEKSQKKIAKEHSVENYIQRLNALYESL
jgi:1,2-diacylglycerol 3-alpha-glucosyltransferase